jgi:hypothetical protein
LITFFSFFSQNLPSEGNFDRMAHDFPPMKNDLVLRTAWGASPRVI